MAKISLPKINDRAWISFDGHLKDTFPTRVESLDGDNYAVAAPFEHIDNDRRKPRPVELTEVPTPAYLAWRVENGYAFTKCEIVEVFDGELILWHIIVEGEPDVMQRRFFVRVPDDSEASLRIGEQNVSCQLIDLSEGGIRCIAPWVEINDESEIEIELEFGDELLDMRARIVRWEITEEGKIQFSLEFVHASENQSGIIRRHVFGKQIRMRKTT